MSSLRDDARTATAIVVVCAALALSVPLATAAVGGVSDGGSGAGPQPPAAAAFGGGGDCFDRSASAGLTSDERTTSPAEDRLDTRSDAAGRSAKRTTVDAPEETVPLGGIAFVFLSVPDGRDSTVTVGAGTNHSVKATVSDDGDGRVRLRINTYAAANGTAVSARAYGVTGADEIEVHTDETETPMTNRTYPIAASRDGTVHDERRLNVTAPDFGTVTALRGPPQLHDAGTLDAVRTAEELGMLSDDRTEYNNTVVRFGETTVLRIESPSFLGAVAAQSGESTTEKLGRVHDYHDRDPPVGFGIRGPCYALEYEKSADNGGVRALSDYTNGTLYLLVDHDRTDGYTGHGRFGINVDSPNPLGNYSGYLAFQRGQYADPDRRPRVDRLGPYSYDQRVDDVVSWPNDGSVVIRGESEQSSLTVGYRSLTDPTYRVSRTVEVQEESFARELPLPAVDRGLFEVTVGNTSYTAKIGGPSNATWELVWPDDTERADRLGVEQLKLEDGGFLVAYRANHNATEFERVGSASVDDVAMSIAPTNESEHLVVVAHRDGNDNGRFDGPETDPPYRVGGDVVREWVTVETTGEAPSEGPPRGSFALSKVGGPAPDLPAQPTAEPTSTPTPTATPTPAGSPTSTAVSDPAETASPAATPAGTDTPTSTASTATPNEEPGTDVTRATATATRTDGASAEGPGFGLFGTLLAVVLLSAWRTRYRRGPP